MKKNIENTMLKPSVNYQTRIPDYTEGDIVQIRQHHCCSGKIGKIIGIKVDRLKDRFCYTVQFSDKESILVNAGSMRFLHHNNSDDSEPLDSDYQVNSNPE